MTFKLLGCTLALSVLLAGYFVPQLTYPSQVFAQEDGGTGTGGTGTGTGDTGTGDTTDTGPTTDPGSIDPNAADPSAVDPNAVGPAEEVQINIDVAPATLEELGLSTTDEGTIFSQDPGIVDVAQEVSIADVPPGVPEGAAFYNDDCNCFQKADASNQAGTPDAPTFDTQAPDQQTPDQPPDTPPDSPPGDGESPNSANPPPLITSPSFLLPCYTPATWVASPPQPIRMITTQPANTKSVQFLLNDLSSNQITTFKATNTPAGSAFWQYNFNPPPPQMVVGRDYRLEATATDQDIPPNTSSPYLIGEFSYSSTCMLPWVQTTGGDVHSNGTISTPGGP